MKNAIARKFLGALGLVLALGLLSGCASSTLPGQIGVIRSQLMIVPAAQVDAMAGEAYAKQTSDARTAGKLNNDEAMTARVKIIAGRLISEVGTYRPEARAWNWQVNVIDSNQLNAYCMPGGRIVVYSGLVRRLNLSDAEIAGVVGHEISHALREHSREKASQQVLGNAVVQGIANSGSRSAPTSAALAAVGAQLFLHLPFSRDMEIEADGMGLELAARAGYDPREAMEIWRKLQREEGTGSTPEFLRTHPTHERRIAESELIAQKVFALYRPRDTAVANQAATMKVIGTVPAQLAASVAPAMAPAALDKGGHSGFAPSCRWVSATVWSCN